MTIHFGAPKNIETIADALPLYSQSEFNSPTRSTIPMLTLLMHARNVFDDIVKELEFPDRYDLFLEYTAGPFRGRGKASHTDVMLTAGGGVVGNRGKMDRADVSDCEEMARKERIEDGKSEGSTARVGGHTG